MLGANRLAVDAWPLFPSSLAGNEVAPRGFHGTKAANTFGTWPLWAAPLTPDAVASLLGLPGLHDDPLDSGEIRGYGVSAVFRSQRILVGKTPNLTPAVALA